MSIFNTAATRNYPRSKFKGLSYERKQSMKMGVLTPIYLEEVFPGDSFRVRTECLTRVAPLVAPVMHRMDMVIEYHFCPIRLIWDDYEDFFTGGRLGNLKPVMPQFQITNSNKGRFVKSRLPDYMEVPPIPEGVTVNDDVFISSLPFRAYAQIYNDWYRDPNLEDELVFSKGSGTVTANDLTTLTTLRRRKWKKDYFTSALPSPQRGGEAIIPIGEVTYKQLSELIDGSTGSPAEGGTLSAISGATTVMQSSGGSDIRVENIEALEPVAINDLRKATALQRWLENSMRGGPRYIEQVYSHWNQTSSDARLQRTELLGAASTPIKISEVLSTAGQQDPQDWVPQGNMAGHGVGYGTYGFKKNRFEEHGYIIGIATLRPKAGYQQGLPRMYSRADKFDFPWPEFAQLGEQEIFNQEIFLDWEAGLNRKQTFGYQSRYADVKYHADTVAGEFRDTLDHWTMNRKFSEAPVLNEQFLQIENINRIFAVTDDTSEDFYVQAYHDVSVIRTLPYHNLPTIL